MRILILGGTTEAAELAKLIADRREFEVTLSLAGRTSVPIPGPLNTRIGGFGGADGLGSWLKAHDIELVVDATHPFAARMSANAAQACAAVGVDLLAIRRPPWERTPDDDWVEVRCVDEAVDVLGFEPRNVFLTVGRLELDRFQRAPQHRYLVRTIEPLEGYFSAPHVTAVRARGPFDRDAERALMRDHAVSVVVTKNSGGTATYGKITAARDLCLPVIIVAQPEKPRVPSVSSAGAAMACIEAHALTP
jgi:precorrin-6A/cobalt-precorrin-6A reductase